MDSSPKTLYKCPSCGELNSQNTAADEFTCSACEQVFKLSGHYCPDCFEYSAENRVNCVNCGELLSRTCAQCGRVNWSGRLGCRYCGQPLDLLSTVSKRHGPTATADRLQAQMQQAKTMRTIDEAASRGRMEELEAAEQVRKNQLWAQELRRRQRDRQLLFFAATVLLLFVVAIIIFSLII